MDAGFFPSQPRGTIAREDAKSWAEEEEIDESCFDDEEKENRDPNPSDWSPQQELGVIPEVPESPRTGEEEQQDESEESPSEEETTDEESEDEFGISDDTILTFTIDAPTPGPLRTGTRAARGSR